MSRSTWSVYFPAPGGFRISPEPDSPDGCPIPGTVRAHLAHHLDACMNCECAPRLSAAPALRPISLGDQEITVAEEGEDWATVCTMIGDNRQAPLDK